MTRIHDAIIGLAALAIAAACLVALVGCSDCRPASVRCADDVLEICDGDGDWRTAEDCGEIEPGSWACCELDAGAECVPEEECGDE